MNIVIHVDGGSRGNPGPAAAGVVIARDDGELLHEAGYFLGHDTNNGAEYKALILALRRVEVMSLSHVAIRSDSELLVRQITGDYRVKSPTLAKLYEQAQMLLLRIPRWQIQHVRREENRRADWLANQALDHQRDVIIFDVDDTNTGDAPGAKSTSASGSVPTPPNSGPIMIRSNQPDTDDAEPVHISSGAQPAQSASSMDQRVVTVKIIRRPADGACPVNAYAGEAFGVDAVLPAGLCIYAANAILPTILAMRGTTGSDFAHVPAMTIRCGSPNCGAQFLISPAISKNGKLK